MAQHQYSILESLFYEEGNSSSSYQRIGDKNQAIFDGNSFSDIWVDRARVLCLNGSHRLSAPIANLVAKFAVSPIAINGNHKNQDGSDIDVKPHIIVYDDLSRHNVIQTFAEIVSGLIDVGKIPTNPSNKYVAIGWRKEHSDADKIAIKDYFSPYVGSSTKSKIDYDSLGDYLVTNVTESPINIGAIREQIINGILRVLRTVSVADAEGRVFSKNKLFHRLESQGEEISI
jgi:hypothetical protein